jgi:hypothetical protein
MSPSPSPWLRRASWIVLGSLALALAAPVQAGDDRPPPRTPAVPAPKPFGETQILRRCLVFIAKSYRDSQSDVENQDWVRLSLENRCPVPVVNLQVELILVDMQGKLYGTSFWILGQGEGLNPGDTWEDSVPIPDPKKQIARAWTLRILHAQTPVRSLPPVLQPQDHR